VRVTDVDVFVESGNAPGCPAGGEGEGETPIDEATGCDCSSSTTQPLSLAAFLGAVVLAFARRRRSR
jgi:MYXO-CTERM domain-containing protein